MDAPKCAKGNVFVTDRFFLFQWDLCHQGASKCWLDYADDLFEIYGFVRMR